MAKQISRFKKSIVVGSATVLTLAGAGIAFAYWTAAGTGVGEATTGDAVAFTIASEPGVGVLAPGAAGQTVTFTVTNAGEGTQYLDSVTVSLADAAGVPWVPAAGCDAADYTATITAPPAAGEIAPGDSVTGVATVVLANTAENQDACQGEAVPLYFVASGAPAIP